MKIHDLKLKKLAVKFKTILIYNILFFLLSGVSIAQDDFNTNQEVAIDSSSLSHKKFSSSIPEKYSGSDFNYTESVGQSQNYLLRAINWFFSKLYEIFGIEVNQGVLKVIEVLIYLVLIIIALYIIIRLLLGTKATSFFTKKSKELSPLSFEEDTIEQINLEELISNALLQKDYRLAIRYMYLKSLKTLSVQNLINWHFEKTNIDYYKELESTLIQEKFRSVSYLYEHIWYGEFNLNESDYISATKEFDSLNKAINSNG